MEACAWPSNSLKVKFFFVGQQTRTLFCHLFFVTPNQKMRAATIVLLLALMAAPAAARTLQGECGEGGGGGGARQRGGAART